MLYTVLGAFIIILVAPDVSYAWGPATHLEIGRQILQNLDALPLPIKALIVKFPYDFLYGTISADAIVGKNLVEKLKHCHNWSFGYKLLKRAEKDSQRSFAYGYLSHLAADTVAHNHFVPEMMVRSFAARTLRHIYWEMRFDALIDKGVWQIPQKIVKTVHDDNDTLLSSTLEEIFLPFQASKRIFSSVLSLHRMERWHSMIGHLSRRSRWVLHQEQKSHFYDQAYSAAVGFLRFGKRARCLRKDPTGEENLKAAKATRRHLNSIKKKGGDWEAAMKEAITLIHTF